MKIDLLTAILIMSLSFIIGLIIGVSGNNPPIIITMDNPEMIKLAMEYHGIESCTVDKDGIYYFIREGEWCSLYSIPFRQWYVQRTEGDK